MLKSRLVHFSLIGGAIFALAPKPEDPRAIFVRSDALVALERAQASREGGDALTPEKSREVFARAVEDEVLYREALRMGLDRDDPIVRQRLIQKLLLLVEDMGGASRAPSEAELRAFFDADPARWRMPPSYRFVHVFASRAEALPPVALLPATGTPSVGEPLPYPRDVAASKQELERMYGRDFAEGVASLSPGAGFSAPIRSTLGFHRVRLDAKVEGRVPSFEEARRGLELDFAMDRREKIVGAYLTKTIAAYRVSIDDKPIAGFVPTRRVAVRADPSAED